MNENVRNLHVALNSLFAAVAILVVSLSLLGGYCSGQRKRISFLEKQLSQMSDLKERSGEKLRQPIFLRTNDEFFCIFRKEAYDCALDECMLTFELGNEKTFELGAQINDSHQLIFFIPLKYAGKPFRLVSKRGVCLFDSSKQKKLSKNSRASSFFTSQKRFCPTLL